MYQTLICAAVPRYDARRLTAAVDAEDVDCAADALVDGMRRDLKFGRDFLGGQVLVDEPEAIELAST